MPFPLLGLSLDVMPNFDGSSLLWIPIAIVIFMVASRLFGPVKAIAITQKASELLTRVHSLGMPFLAPVLQAVAAGKWKEVPGLVEQLFTQLANKETRRPLLFGVLKALLEDHLADAEKKGPVLQLIESILGTKIPKPPATP